MRHAALRRDRTAHAPRFEFSHSRFSWRLCSWVVSTTRTWGVPSRSTVTLAVVDSPSDSKTCRPRLGSSKTVPLMSVMTSPALSPSASNVVAVAPRIYAESDDLAFLDVRRDAQISVRRDAFCVMTWRNEPLAPGACAAGASGIGARAVAPPPPAGSFGSRSVSSWPLRSSNTRSASTECNVAPLALSIV